MIKTTSFALMFDARPGGEIVPIKWDKNSFMPETSIIVLDEDSESVYLWHGVKQGLVARRTALRQAESLKGHGYTIGKTIIGRDIKGIKEIDSRKVGKVPEDTKMYEDLQEILDRKFTQLDNFIVTFQAGAIKPVVVKREEPKVQAKTAPTPTKAPATTPVVSKPVSAAKPREVASEYESTEPMPSIKSETKPAPVIEASTSSLLTDAKVAFVFSAILEHYDDIWVSKKQDGSFAVEQMDGPICQFSIKEGSKLNFTTNSFSGVDTKITMSIKKKFIELSKLI
ncbi:MAG: hypothetical protein HWN81_21655 [Candidatus Lokiarchaeota archaeon]|nr:hypothetical protein [Candidatus Lokiarchaeota archaeon]